MSYEVRGLQIGHANVGAGWTKLFDAPGPGLEMTVYQIAVTASEDCKVQFGGPGAPATAEFSLAKGVPLVLPHSAHGWWEFDGNADIGVNVATAAPSIDVGIHAMFKKG